jgi:hypothetical protein
MLITSDFDLLLFSRLDYCIVYIYESIGEIPYDKEEKIMRKNQHNSLYWRNPRHYRRKNSEEKTNTVYYIGKILLINYMDISNILKISISAFIEPEYAGIFICYSYFSRKTESP